MENLTELNEKATYLGDGVYAMALGDWGIKLLANHPVTDTIVIEYPVYLDLVRYAERVFGREDAGE